MSSEDLPGWTRRRRRPPFWGGSFFREFDEMVREMEVMMEEAFKEAEAHFPKELIRERRTPEGKVVREVGPVVYGYSVTLGPDGRPIVREFGNLKPRLKGRGPASMIPSLDVRTEREPLVDIFSDDGSIKVVAELPGVEKTDVKLHATPNSLTISVERPDRRYYKELDLPEPVNPKSARSLYRNGVLEVTLSKAEAKKPRGEPIKVE